MLRLRITRIRADIITAVYNKSGLKIRELTMRVNIKKLRGDALLPQYKTDGAAGMDICYAGDGDIVIRKGETVLVPSGLAVAPETDDCVILLYARSGLSLKHGITMVNGVGVIDSDYRGELKCPMINLGKEDYVIKPGDRVGQIVFTPVIRAELVECEALDETVRNENGFGSTGR